MSVNPIPKGYHTVTPYLIVKDAMASIEFMQKAFDATLDHVSKNPAGKIMHTELKIGDSMLMMGEAMEGFPAMPCGLYLYVPDTDKLYLQALAAGATSIMEPADQFYGDRNAGVVDAEGNKWWIGTHIEDVSMEEIAKRMSKS
jgi:PhnB protein